MTAYLFMIIVWVAGYYYLLYRSQQLTDKTENNHKRLFVVIASLTMFIIMGLRHKGVGTDTIQYLRIYHSSSVYNWNYLTQLQNIRDSEIGFKFLNYLLYRLHLTDQIYLILYAGIMAFGIGKLIWKYCKNPFWGFYLHTTIGLFTMSMSGIRQSLACLICWLAIDFILEKKPIRFILMILLATSFHQSAIFFSVFYFARYVNIDRVNGWFLSIFCGICVALRSILVPVLNMFMPERYDKYSLVSERYTVNPMVVIIGLLIPIFCLFFWESKKIKTEKEKQIYSLMYAGSFCYAFIMVLSMSSMMIGRMGMYFYLFNVVLLGNIISEIEDFHTRVVASVFAIILPGYMFFKSQSLGIAPYYFFWQTYGM